MAFVTRSMLFRYFLKAAKPKEYKWVNKNNKCRNTVGVCNYFTVLFLIDLGNGKPLILQFIISSISF